MSEFNVTSPCRRSRISHVGAWFFCRESTQTNVPLSWMRTAGFMVSYIYCDVRLPDPFVPILKGACCAGFGFDLSLAAAERMFAVSFYPVCWFVTLSELAIEDLGNLPVDRLQVKTAKFTASKV